MPEDRLESEDAVARLLEAESAAHDALANTEARAAARLEAARGRAHAILERATQRTAGAVARAATYHERELEKLRAEVRRAAAVPGADDPRFGRLEHAVARLAKRMTGAGDER